MATAPTTGPETAAAVELLRALGPGRSFLLRGASWDEYELLCEVRDTERPGVKIVFDRGDLEAMSPLFVHDKSSRRLAMVVLAVAEECDVPVIGGGGTTFRRKDLERGLEPDECFYVQHVEAVRHLDDIDLTRDPPPDLAVEVDITRNSALKEAVYGGLGIPELWVYDGDQVEFKFRRADGAYAAGAVSRAFPVVTSDDLTRFLHDHPGLDDVTFLKAVRAWVRLLLANRQPPA